jgi:hypothetical protein
MSAIISSNANEAYASANFTNDLVQTSNNGGLATEDEVELDNQAQDILRGFANPISPAEIHEHFQHPNTTKKVVLIKRCTTVLLVYLEELRRQRELAPKRRSKAIYGL